MVIKKFTFAISSPDELLVMAALHSRCGHYIFILWFLTFFLLFSFFPRLISTVADWMCTILPHMVWPYCKFRMHVWNVLHATRWKYRTQKIAKNSTEVSQTLQDVWPSAGLVRYIYIFGGCCPLRDFCQLQNSLYVQVLRSPILPALLHGTPAAR